MYKVKNVCFTYPDNEKVIDNLSFEINKGDFVVICGESGCGKTTLLRLLKSSLQPTGTLEGTIELDEQIKKDIQIGFVFQNPDDQIVMDKVWHEIAFGLENQGIPREEMVMRVQDALDKVRMLDFAKREPARLSGGQKQRVAIAGVVVLRPDIIILDEATSMLDPEGREEVISTIKKIKDESNLTVISITHDIDEAANASRILVMKQGSLVNEGTPQEIFSAGPELINLGLDLPFPEKLKSALKQRGIEVPTEYMTEERMVDWLWTSVLKK